jgi:hypothetical protein
MFVDINIYESIFQPFVTAKLTIIDTHDLVYRGPIVGDEEIEITAVDNDDKIFNWKFVVYKLERDNNAKQGQVSKQLLILYLITKEEKNNILKRISRRLEDLPHNLVSYVVEKYLEGTVIDLESGFTDKIPLTANYWKPLEIINYIEEQTVDCLFYQNQLGFHFKSVADLMNTEFVEKLTWKQPSDTTFKVSDIISYSIQKYFNLKELGMIFQGLGTTNYRFDDIEYRWYKEQNDFETVSEYTTNLGKKLDIPTSWKTYNSEIKRVYNDEKIENRRKLLNRLFDKYKLTLRINGKKERNIGENYLIEYFIRERETSDKININLTGFWFLVSIRHHFLKSGEYNQVMNLVKNGFNSYSYKNIPDQIGTNRVYSGENFTK